MPTVNGQKRGWGDPTRPGYASSVVSFKVDGAQWNVHRDVKVIFEEFLTRMHKECNYRYGEIYDDWSYILRPIRGYEKKYLLTKNPRYLSEHSWALSVDVNSTQNPMGDKLITDMPIRWINEVAPEYGIEWGGNWKNRPDAMHFQFNGTPNDAARITGEIIGRRAKAKLMAKLDKDDLDAIGDLVQEHIKTVLGDSVPGDLDGAHVSLSDIHDQNKEILRRLKTLTDI